MSNGNGTVMNEWKFREQMCEIGRRIYNKGFAAANDGNISLPARRGSGALHADAGVEGLHEARRPLHRRPGRQAGLRQAEAVERDPAAPDDHEGPARRQVGRALPSAPCDGLRRGPRADPQVRPARDRGLPGRGRDLSLRDAGGQSFADTVLPYVKDTETILLANHGTVTYGTDLEDAYFKTEIIDAYCRILILARQLGRVNYYDRREGRRAASSSSPSWASPTRGWSGDWRTATSAATACSAKATATASPSPRSSSIPRSPSSRAGAPSPIEGVF